MPKNIYLSKENISKIVEVREVENHIPSYEEFLKSYNQESINYDDLTHEDISSSRGYGPMWSNSQYGERWTSLRIPCPVGGCSNTNIINRTHTCGGQIEISNRVRIRCQRCGSAGGIESWNFSCSSHHGGYRTTNSTDFNSFARVLMSALSNRSMDKDIVIELLQHLRSSSW